MKATVNANDLYRLLAMIPVAPNQMSPEDFTAFINLAGASVSSPMSPVCEFIRVASQDVFKAVNDNGYPKIGKMQCIKAIREATGVGLKEAKDCSDGMWMAASLTHDQITQLKYATPGVIYETK